jgi:hypothetical protein
MISTAFLYRDYLGHDPVSRGILASRISRSYSELVNKSATILDVKTEMIIGIAIENAADASNINTTIE